MMNIRKSFSAKLSLSILLLAMLIFIASLGVLFFHSRHLIRLEALGRVNSVLNTTMQRLNLNLMTIITATNANSWQVEQQMEPEALLSLTRRIVMLNPHMDGCSISLEPNAFPQHGRYFSAYSIREGDSITTVYEEEYEYFEKIWYKKAHDLNAPCWVLYRNDTDTLEVVLKGILASYSKPLYHKDGSFAGIFSADLSMIRLSKFMSKEKPYPHSYFVMIDELGRYIVHPDSTMLFSHTIFGNADPRKQADIFALGHQMIEGKEGHMSVVINGAPCLVCYQPVEGTTWSLAVICPDSDVLAGYHRLTYIVIPLMVIGLLVILLLTYRTVIQAIKPLNKLLKKTQSIAEGDMTVEIKHTSQEDAIGHLQNSFATMLQTIRAHTKDIQATSEQARRQNEELTKATHMAQEAERQKTAFIQNVSHQIRTPLNIIMGFAQVLNSQKGIVSEEERKSIMSMMNRNSKVLSRMVLMLFDSSDTGQSEEQKCHQHDWAACNDIAREAISFISIYHPDIRVSLLSDVGDDLLIKTNQLFLMRSLRELLYNSAKYSDRQNIRFIVHNTGKGIQFIVEDTGKGIPEAVQGIIFKFFAKGDDLSEGLGLGLPLAKRHAQTLGGDLTLDANYKEGCRFVLELPLTD